MLNYIEKNDLSWYSFPAMSFTIIHDALKSAWDNLLRQETFYEAPGRQQTALYSLGLLVIMEISCKWFFCSDIHDTVKRNILFSLTLLWMLSAADMQIRIFESGYFKVVHNIWLHYSLLCFNNFRNLRISKISKCFWFSITYTK